MQALLGRPSALDHDASGAPCWRRRSAPADKGVMAIVPGGFDEHASQMGIARLGDGAARAFRAARVLRRHQPDKRHRARCRRKAPRVAELGGDRQRREIVDAAETPQARRRATGAARASADRAAPSRRCGGGPPPRRPCGDRRGASGRARRAATLWARSHASWRFVHAFFVPVKRRPWRKRNLDSRCRARSRSARISSRQRSRSRAASSCSVGMWTAVKRAGAIEHRQLAGIAPVRLDPIARPPRNQRRRNHVTGDLAARQKRAATQSRPGPAS